MSQICAIVSCKRSSCALCHCCQQNICLPHLKEHQELLASTLDPMVDQINAFSDRLNAVNVADIINDARQELKEWRVESHRKIDLFFQQKCHELDQRITVKIKIQREEIDQIQSKAAELIREQHATRHDLDLLTSKIENLKREIDRIDRTNVKVKVQAFTVKDSWITIEETNKHHFDLSNLPPIYKSIRHNKERWPSIASNGQFLLMHQHPNLCLVDQNLTIVEQNSWNSGNIHDMCYSTVLNQFIVTSSPDVFLVNQNRLSMERVSLTQKHKWCSCTCSDESLFLSTSEYGSSIVEYSLLPSMQFSTQWKPPISCKQNEYINHMRFNNKTLAVLISQGDTQFVYIELRTVKTLQRLWSLQLNIRNACKMVFSFCSINHDEWLICDHENYRLICITNGGKMKAMCDYDPCPMYPCMFGSDMLAVSHGKGINFHKL